MQHVSDVLCGINQTQIHSPVNDSLHFKTKFKSSYFVIFLIICHSIRTEAGQQNSDMNESNDIDKKPVDITHLLFDHNTNISRIVTINTVKTICDFTDRCSIFSMLNGFKLDFCGYKLSEIIWSSVWNSSGMGAIGDCGNLRYRVPWPMAGSSGNVKYSHLSDVVIRYLGSSKRCRSTITGLIELDNQARSYWQQFKQVVVVHQSFHITATKADSKKATYLLQCLVSGVNRLSRVICCRGVLGNSEKIILKYSGKY